MISRKGYVNASESWSRSRIKAKGKHAKGDIESASSQWAGWSLERKRSFIRMATESITLEELADGWLRLVIVWCPLMRFYNPMPRSISSKDRSVDTAYIWRPSGSYWSDEDINTLIAHYPNASRVDLLHMLPQRSWLAIMQKGIKSGLHRMVGSDPLPIPNDTSLSDMHVVKEFALQPGERIQWHNDLVTNGDFPS